MSVKRKDNRLNRVRDGQSKNWSFTMFAINTSTIEEYEDNFYELSELKKTNICSIAFGRETCPKTKRLHLQGFLQLYAKCM